jgi:hypothetical protein
VLPMNHQTDRSLRRVRPHSRSPVRQTARPPSSVVAAPARSWPGTAYFPLPIRNAGISPQALCLRTRIEAVYSGDGNYAGTRSTILAQKAKQ